MAYCTNCGTQTNDAVCPSCGAAMETAAPQQNPAAPQQNPAAPQQNPAAPQQNPAAPQQNPAAPQQPYTAQPPYGYRPPYYPQQPAEEPVSVLGWIGRSLIPYIPFVGGLVYLIMLFLWMGDNTKQETFRNWAKAQLIVMAIAVGLCALAVFLLIAMGVAIGEAVMAY